MKTTISILTILVFAISANAQRFNFGVKAGVNFSDQSYKAQGVSISPASRTGFHAGAYMSYMFVKQFGVQPELLYSQAGSDWKSQDVKVKMKMDYLSLPVLFTYQPTRILNLNIGPQISYRLRAEGNDENMDSKTRDIELAGAIGAGVNLSNGAGITVRYTLGLTDAFNVHDLTVKNNILQVSATYRFYKIQ